MCVFVENAGFGSVVAAPIARQLLQKFFGILPTEMGVPAPQEDEEDIYDIEEEVEVEMTSKSKEEF
jgi:hypothetical protein